MLWWRWCRWDVLVCMVYLMCLVLEPLPVDDIVVEEYVEIDVDGRVPDDAWEACIDPGDIMIAIVREWDGERHRSTPQCFGGQQ